MNILITIPHPVWPINYGAAARTFNIAKSLAKIGHKVTLLSPEPITQQYKEHFTWEAFNSSGVLGHFFNISFIKKIKEILNDEFDLILMEFPYQIFMVLPQAKKYNIPIVYDAHNVEADRFLSMGSRLKSFLVGLTENYLCKNAKAVLAVSDEDMAVLKSKYQVQVKLLPNGVDLEKFIYSKASQRLLDKYDLTNKKVVLYFGTFDYSPNVEALKYLTEEIWPKVSNKIKDASLLVVGKNPPLWLKSSNNVVVAGLVDDIVEHIQLAHVVAVPLFSGGGSRLKIIEALACGKTVLSTEFGATGISDKDQLGLVLSDIENFSDKLIKLLSTVTGDINQASRNLAIKLGWDELLKKINLNELIHENKQ